MTRSVASTIEENLQWRLDQLSDLLRGHNAVHPDRGQCGGVGNCRMMSAEVELNQEIEEQLERAARHNLQVSVKIEGKRA